MTEAADATPAQAADNNLSGGLLGDEKETFFILSITLISLLFQRLELC